MCGAFGALASSDNFVGVGVVGLYFGLVRLLVELAVVLFGDDHFLPATPLRGSRLLALVLGGRLGRRGRSLRLDADRGHCRLGGPARQTAARRFSRRPELVVFFFGATFLLANKRLKKNMMNNFDGVCF